MLNAVLISIIVLALSRALYLIYQYNIQKTTAPVKHKHLTVAEIRAMNEMYRKQAVKEIELERGKLLAFRRKNYYRSNK